MADKLLSLEDVCKELQLEEVQVKALVKQGVLRGLRDQNKIKFRKADVEKYKQATESSATVVFDTPAPGSGKPASGARSPDDTGTAIDLDEIEAEMGADESDQTSVMAPVDEKEAADKGEAQPVFEFSEKELGLTLEGGDEDGSVLVADDSDSSLDILDVTDESSSDSATSAAEINFLEEPSSSEDVATVLEAEDESPEALAVVDTSDTATVSDILGDSEGSDEELETLDLDEVVETQETAVETLEDDVPLAGAPETVETVPVGGEVETVGIAGEDVTQAVEAELETGAMAEMAEAVELEQEYEPARVAAGWELVVPSVVGNAFLILCVFVAALGGMFLLCEISGTTNIVAEYFAQYVAEHFPVGG